MNALLAGHPEFPLPTRSMLHTEVMTWMQKRHELAGKPLVDVLEMGKAIDWQFKVGAFFWLNLLGAEPTEKITTLVRRRDGMEVDISDLFVGGITANQIGHEYFLYLNSCEETCVLVKASTDGQTPVKKLFEKAPWKKTVNISIYLSIDLSI